MNFQQLRADGVPGRILSLTVLEQIDVTNWRGPFSEAITLQAVVVRTIRPDTVFIPYHWPGDRSANRLTHRTLDPRSKIPEYKVSACRIEKAVAPGGQP